MRIALRTSGGRGEYELAGRQGAIGIDQVSNKPFYYEITPGLVLPGGVSALRAQGKPRLRKVRKNDRSTTHPPLLLAAILLLPKPKRQLRETHGTVLLMHDAYSVSAIRIDIADIQAASVVLRPTDLLLQNADGLSQRIVFAERMARITRLWNRAAGRVGPLAELIRNHMDAVMEDSPSHRNIESFADAIAESLDTDGDMLPLAEAQLGIEPIDEMPFEGQEEEIIGEFGENDPQTQIQARLERIKQWREVVLRGAEGARFRREIRRHYADQCLFSGDTLPKLSVTGSAGVDAAHILPWSTHDIHTADNGICLNKMCHWAFDAGVLRLTFDRPAKVYVLDIPQAVQVAATAAGFSMDYFKRLAGPIQRDRLPDNHDHWPKPEHLVELNKFMFPA